MLRCWKYLPTDRPTFSELVQTVDNILSEAMDNVSGITLSMFLQPLIASLAAETVVDWGQPTICSQFTFPRCLESFALFQSCGKQIVCSQCDSKFVACMKTHSIDKV